MPETDCMQIRKNKNWGQDQMTKLKATKIENCLSERLEIKDRLRVLIEINPNR